MCQCQKMVIVLRLILQNTSGQNNHWNWYCKTPSTDIGVDIAIATHVSDFIVLVLILQNTSFWYCNWCCYCKTPLTNIIIDIGIAKQSPWILEVKQYQKFYYCAALFYTQYWLNSPSFHYIFLFYGSHYYHDAQCIS